MRSVLHELVCGSYATEWNAPKNILEAVEWGVLDQLPCAVKLLPVSKPSAGFYDFDDYERLVDAARTESNAFAVVLLGGEAGLRCGEMMALEWRDVDFQKRQICVQRSEWKGHVGVPKGGRLRYVPMTVRLANALRERRHLRSFRVLCLADGSSLSADVVIPMTLTTDRPRLPATPGTDRALLTRVARDAGGHSRAACKSPHFDEINS